MRPVEAADADRLLAWANDATTRAMSFHTQPIARADHERWLAARLASPSARFYIGLERAEPIGQVRFERRPWEVVEIGIALAPEARGRGLGRQLLTAGMIAAQQPPALGGQTYLARVRRDNTASIRLFKSAGFVVRPCAADPAELVVCFERAIEGLSGP